METSNSITSYHPTKFKIQINVRNNPTYFCWLACTFYDVASEIVRLIHQEERTMNQIQMGNPGGGNNSALFAQPSKIFVIKHVTFYEWLLLRVSIWSKSLRN